METCRCCGKKFDPELAEDDFILEYSTFSYLDGFIHPICFECAQDVIENEVSGEYFETCEKCGKRFDYFSDALDFDIGTSSFVDGLSLKDMWDGQILCADCAIEKAESMIEEWKENYR